MPPLELASGVQASHARHGDVEDREIDVFHESGCDRLGSVTCLRDDPQVRLCVQQHSQAVADDA